MNIIKRMAVRVALRIFDSSIEVDYKKIDKSAMEDWAYNSFDDRGWRSYYAYETMKIFKEMSFAQEREQYLILVGRRLMLLHMFDEFRRAMENKKTRDAKRAAEAEEKGGGRNA